MLGLEFHHLLHQDKEREEREGEYVLLGDDGSGQICRPTQLATTCRGWWRTWRRCGRRRSS